MAATGGFEIHQLIASIRFIQGYRFLDRCGETLIQLERTLDEGWIPAETAPAGGSIRNDLLGMSAAFNSASMTVQQTEFISFEHFRDQTCKIYETLWRTLEIEKIHVCTFRIIFQKGFSEDEVDQAEQYFRELHLCDPANELLDVIGGTQTALKFAVVTEQDHNWNESPVHRRRRFEGGVIRQQRQRSLDERLLQRARLLPKYQRDALAGLQRLRRQHPEIAPVAVQLDVEDSLETEFLAKELDLPAFLEQTWQWAEQIKNEIPQLRKGKKHG